MEKLTADLVHCKNFQRSQKGLEVIEKMSREPKDLVNAVIELLVSEGYTELAKQNKNHPIWFDDIERDIREYGVTLTYPPEFPNQENDLVELDDGSGWSVDVPLYSIENGKTDLTLQMFINKGNDGSLSFEVFSIHVL